MQLNLNSSMLLKAIKYMGIALLIYFSINLLLFGYELYKVNSIDSVAFDNGTFYINSNQIGHDIKSSIGFIGLMFVVLIFDNYQRTKRILGES